jgi:hypothetical protein
MTRRLPVAQLVLDQLHEAKITGRKPDHWEIGIERLKELFASGLVERLDPSSFKIADLPVRVNDEDSDHFSLHTS